MGLVLFWGVVKYLTSPNFGRVVFRPTRPLPLAMVWRGTCPLCSPLDPPLLPAKKTKLAVFLRQRVDQHFVAWNNNSWQFICGAWCVGVNNNRLSTGTLHPSCYWTSAHCFLPSSSSSSSDGKIHSNRYTLPNRNEKFRFRTTATTL